MKKIQYCEPQEKYYVVLKPETAISTAVVLALPICHAIQKKIPCRTFESTVCKRLRKVVRTQYPEVEKAPTMVATICTSQINRNRGLCFAEFDDENQHKLFSTKPKEFFGFVAKGLNVSPLHAMLKQLSTNQSIYTQPEVI